MKRKSNSLTGNMLKMGIGNLISIPLIGATASAVGAIPAGTAKNIAGMAPALQSTALVGHNIGFVKRSLSSKKKAKFF